MIPFQDKDERLKIILFIFCIFIVQGVIFSLIYFSSLKEINNSILNQNYEIMGYLNHNGDFTIDEVVPIITGKNIINAEVLREQGKNILAKYSYGSEVNYNNNPLLKGAKEKYLIYLFLIVLGTFGLILFGVMYYINPLYKEIGYLTYRAENLLENKQGEAVGRFNYKGSLDKFIIKFSMMEERINNSIGLLQEEKINLKNIINDISHQLKTPLMALTMYNDILEDHKSMEPYEVDNFISLSNEQLKRMDWLVKTLLKYARLEGNVVEYKKEYYPLNNTIEEAMAPLMVKAKEKNQEISFISDKDVILYHDRKWVGEALSNIIKNAIEHTGKQGRIEIGVEETPVTVRIWIKDNGEGIPKNEIKKIFNRFYKGQSSINPTSIGIGLCLSRSIINSHNGDITVESKEGEGSIFYITFLKL